MSRDVSIALPGDLVWNIWRIAEERGMSVAEVVRDGLVERHGIDPPPQTVVTRKRVIELVMDGWDDGSIAVEIDRVRAYVANVRRKAGLAPNKRKRVVA